MRFCLIFLLNAFFERFLKDKGISFHNLAPILEKELAYKWAVGDVLCRNCGTQRIECYIDGYQRHIQIRLGFF